MRNRIIVYTPDTEWMVWLEALTKGGWSLYSERPGGPDRIQRFDHRRDAERAFCREVSEACFSASEAWDAMRYIAYLMLEGRRPLDLESLPEHVYVHVAMPSVDDDYRVTLSPLRLREGPGYLGEVRGPYGSSTVWSHTYTWWGEDPTCRVRAVVATAARALDAYRHAYTAWAEAATADEAAEAK